MSTNPINYEVLDALSDLLSYPQEDYAEHLKTTHALLASLSPAAAAAMEPLIAHAGDNAQGAIEELYTRTFDMNPSCALELGWHLYGEDYDRGAFLVTVRDMMRRHGVEESGELPDHVTHCLRLLGRLDEEEAGRFSKKQALPALERILLNFKDSASPYRTLLQGIRDLLTERFGPADKVAASAFACPSPYEEAPLPCSGMPMSDWSPPSANTPSANTPSANTPVADTPLDPKER